MPPGLAQDVQPGLRHQPLEPGRPTPLLGWLRGRPARLPTWLRVGGAVALTLAIGTWGFSDLRFHSHPSRLTFFQSLYNAVKLYTVNLGPAGGGSGSPSPNVQIWVALVLAAFLVVRAVFGLARERLRRGATRYLLRDHVIVCGGGVHGAELVGALCGGRPAEDDRGDPGGRGAKLDAVQPMHDVVLVDIDPAALGMRVPRGKYEWRLVGDSVLERTLITAGAARASWIVAITGDDYVNSQIASTVHTLVEGGRARERVHVLVQVEDPSLTRFLEEDVELVRRKAGPSSREKLPIVSPFSANTTAAEALLDDARCADGSSLLALHEGRAPNILLAGDHPLIDALLLAAVRRWQEQILHDLEAPVAGSGPPMAGARAGSTRPPIHISVFGPDAIGRVARIQRRWRPETSVAAIEATDAELSDEAAYEWLREEGRADHAFIACTEELEGVGLTLGVSRALGPEVLMSRVTAEPGSVLDEHMEVHSKRSNHLATTAVRQLSRLACQPDALRSLAAPQRLGAALAAAPGVSFASTDTDAKRLAEGLFLRPEIEIHSDSSWRLPACERELLGPLLDPVPLSALVRSRLVVDLSPPETLRAIATKLSQGDPTGLGFTAWCLYARGMRARELRASLSESEGLSADELERRQLPGSEIARSVLRLRADATDPSPGSPRGPLAERRLAPLAVLAGGAGGMSAMTADASRALLERALIGYDGTILTGGTAVGLPGIAGEVASRLGIFTVGYAPRGRGTVGYHRLLRETDSDEFSARQPVQMWGDILDGRIRTGDVRVLVFPGGPITHQEIVLALALGAAVAWVDPLSESVEPLENQLPLGAPGVLELPADTMTIRAFLRPSRLTGEERTILEPIARSGHSAYVRGKRIRQAAADPAVAPWEELVFTLKRSSLAQVEDIPNKLALVGKRLKKGSEPLVLTSEQVELLGEVEHGRWNVERLASGWTFGERDIARKTSPYLVPWSDLDEEVREFDRQVVRNIAPALEEVGWGVVDA